MDNEAKNSEICVFQCNVTNIHFVSYADNLKLGNIELNIDTINNHPALMSYFANPSFKKDLLEIPLIS